MDRPVDQLAMEATILSLVAAALLITAGSLGIGGSAVLIATLGVTAVGFYLVGERVPSLGRVLGHDLDQYVWDLWIAPLVAALVVALELGASAEEVVALGGLIGLVGMANYFLRPVYHVVVATLSSVRGAVQPDEENRPGG
ncbi:MAG: hypothetical protein ABEH35_05165 [Haloarculaceae archaeon]